MERYCLMTFRGSTAAMATHKALQARMPAMLVPVLRQISASCGMAVRLPAEHADEARALMPDGSALYLIEDGQVTPL